MKVDIVDNMVVVDGQQVEFHQSPNVGGTLNPTLIVEHYTGDNSLSGAVSWLCAPESQVSAHVVVSKDGTIVQLVPFNVVAWHAGRSSYNGRNFVNSFAIGIENVGVGDEWPDMQVEANRALIAALFKVYPIENVVGHQDVAPGRKSDPGPNFPWDKVTS